MTQGVTDCKGAVLNRLQASHPHPLSIEEVAHTIDVPLPDVAAALYQLRAEYEVLRTKHGLWLYVPPLTGEVPSDG